MFYRTKKITYGMVGEIKPRLYNILMFPNPTSHSQTFIQTESKKKIHPFANSRCINTPLLIIRSLVLSLFSFFNQILMLNSTQYSLYFIL